MTTPPPPTAPKRDSKAKVLAISTCCALGIVVLIGGIATSGMDPATTSTTASGNASTSTADPAAPTTAAPDAPTTVALTPEMEHQANVMAFGLVFEENRADFAKIFQDQPTVQSVDLVTFDPATETVTVSLTSIFSTPEVVNDQAWELMKAVADGLYATPGQGWNLETFSPAMSLVINGTYNTCTGDFMKQMAAFQADRAAWETAC